jgi:predicted ABC-type transport system involved in lysophospholipase L1 biosynthesis ATPase subunit
MSTASRPETSDLAPNNDPVIELAGTTKVYGQGASALQALRGIDLRIRQGEFVAIMGPSGSGKSTVMNILGCLDTPTSGSYRFRGVHVEKLSRDQRALLRRNFLGFVFQGYALPRSRMSNCRCFIAASQRMCDTCWRGKRSSRWVCRVGKHTRPLNCPEASSSG